MNKKISLNEHINTIKKRINYINESPIYNKFDGEEYDEIPNGIFEAGDEDLPPDKLKVPTNSSDKGASETTAADAELPPAEGNGVPVPDINQGDLPPVGGDVPAPQPVEQTPDVDEIQNDIIKHNLLAIKDIHAQLSNLNTLADSLNNKLDIIAKDVDEVREPTNGEKLMSKTRVSYPFYLNLNDNWKDNWFEQNSNNTDKGIIKLSDGTYIADFDDLPKSSSTDVLNSF